MEIRSMREEDLEAISGIDFRAFSPKIPAPRTPESLRARLAQAPEGCFTAFVDGKAAGFTFSRTWGKLGWIGALAVEPELGGKGLGKALLAAAANWLEGRSCRVIGLETRADVPSNIGLYAGAGFRLGLSTLTLTKILPAGEEARLEPMDAADFARAVAKIRPELDMRGEAETEIASGCGAAYRLDGDAFFLLREGTIYRGYAPGSLQLQFGLTRGRKPGTLARAMLALEAHARHLGRGKLMIQANSAEGESVEQLLKLGFKVEMLRARLFLRGSWNAGRGVELCSWAV
jgi:GNAT superfamily N-acetyltransferase